MAKRAQAMCKERARGPRSRRPRLPLLHHRLRHRQAAVMAGSMAATGAMATVASQVSPPIRAAAAKRRARAPGTNRRNLTALPKLSMPRAPRRRRARRPKRAARLLAGALLRPAPSRALRRKRRQARRPPRLRQAHLPRRRQALRRLRRAHRRRRPKRSLPGVASPRLRRHITRDGGWEDPAARRALAGIASRRPGIRLRPRARARLAPRRKAVA